MKIESNELIRTLRQWQADADIHTGLKEFAAYQKVIDEIKRMKTNEEIKQRIETGEETQEAQNEGGEIKAIAGMLNGDCTVRFWRVPNGMAVNIGDYVVVENRDGHDLVKVVGFVETTEECEKFLTGNRRGIKKSVVAVILKELLLNKGEV